MTATQQQAAIELANQYWHLSVQAHHAKAWLMKSDAMDQHFETVERIAKAANPQLWEDVS